MEKLNKIARERARATVARAFPDPGSLDEIAQMDSQLEKSLHAVEGQLKSAMQSKLDSLKRAVDLMDESAAKLNKISVNIVAIDEKIAKTNTQISNYYYLKRAHNARDNLMKVIQQVQFFAEVPQKVQELRTRLEEHPETLREVFLESIKLESLRETLIKEMNAARIQRRNGSLHENDQVRQKVEHHLREVPDLILHIQQVVFGYLSRLLDVADRQPEQVVTTFEVLTMQAEYNDRRNKSLLIAQLKNPALVIREHPDVWKLAKERITTALWAQVEGEFALLDSLTEESKSQATAIRTIGTRLLQRIEEYAMIVVPCIPPNIDLILLFIECLEDMLLPALRTLLSQTSLETMKVSDILDMISWFDYLTESFTNFNYEFANRPSIGELAKMKEELMATYKERIKTQIGTWFGNIAKQEFEIKQQSSDGTLVSSRPEDMFNLLHQQVSVAEEKLPIEYVHEVAIACLQVLQDQQRTAIAALEANLNSNSNNPNHQNTNPLPEIEPETLCALVNDNQRMNDKCTEFKDRVTKLLLKQDLDEKAEFLSAIAEEVAMQYLSIAQTAVSALARCIGEVLDEEVFVKVFSPEWEAQGNTSLLIQTIGATLDDYFRHLSHWLSYYHFSKLLRRLLNMVIDRYVMSIRRRADGDFVFRNEIKASNVVVQDHKTLHEYFDKYLEDLRNGGMREAGLDDKAALLKELEPIYQLSFAISCRSMSSAEKCCKALFARYGIDGLKAAQGCFFCNPVLSKMEKQNLCEAAKKLFDNAQPPYNTQPMVEFVGFDTGIDAVVAIHKATQEKAARTGGFWSRRK